jgi:hypothetical protein
LKDWTGRKPVPSLLRRHDSQVFVEGAEDEFQVRRRFRRDTDPPSRSMEPAHDGQHMKTAIGIGGRVIPVNVEHVGEDFTATCSEAVRGEMQLLAVTADSYDGALQALRGKILAAHLP